MDPMRTLLSLILISTTPLLARAAEPGDRIEEFKLPDCRGGWHALSEPAEAKAVVVAFIGVECPVVQTYAPILARLAADYEPQGVAFLAIGSNRQDSLAELGHFARTHKLRFPVLKDAGNKVADQFGAQRTPEVFVLDRRHVVRYRGRIDDQSGVGFRRANASRRDLALALDELLAGREIAVAKTEPAGCHLSRVPRRPAKGDVTYSKHIAPLIQKHCVSCHRARQVGPFTLTAYEDVAAWADTIREAVDGGRMPPWYANPEHGRFINEARVSEEEKRLLDEWVANGTPEGNPADLPPPPEFAGEWAIPEPDLVVTMPEPFTVPAKGTVPYKVFMTDVSFDEDRWLIASEGRPGNRAVVHHMLFFYVPPGERISPEMPLYNALGGYVPGLPTGTLPEGIARRIPAGSKLAFQMHYMPNGEEQSDQSSVGLVFTDPKNVKKSWQIDMALNIFFRIPAGAKDYRLEASHRFDEDTLLYTLQPHMHLRGKSFRFDAIYPDGRTETLLDVPRYDFNWQLTYALAQPKLLPEGTRLHCTAIYDNSADNLVNPDPTKAVMWGDQTWEEMLVGAFDTVSAEQDLTLGPPSIRKRRAEYEVTFRYRPTIAAQRVYLSGDFNRWQSTAHAMQGPDREGRYSTTLALAPGKYEYKFVLDGTKWRSDPGNIEQVKPSRNSVLRLGATHDRGPDNGQNEIESP
jgi:peroxiredoxin/mono/diheme cytochrome c family protein